MFILPWLKGGNAETYVVNLARSIDPKEFEVLVWCKGDWGPVGDELGRMGVKVMDGPISPLRPDQMFRLWRYVRREHVDIIHSLSLRPTAGEAFMSKLMLRKYVSSRRSTRQWEGKNKVRMRDRVRDRFTDKIVTNSNMIARLAGRLENVPVNKLVTIYDGVPMDELSQWSSVQDGEELRKRLNIPEIGYVIVNVADMRHSKGQMYLLKAFHEARSKFLGETHLIICGEGEERDNLELFIKHNSLGSRVHIIGAEEKPAVMAAGDVFVVSSLGEGFSRSIIEAMALGMPIIATSVGGNPEVVMDGLNGIIVPPADSDKLSDAMLRVGNNIARRKDMGQKSLDRARSEFTLEKMAQAHEEMYSKLMGKD
ncbi:MAG: Trehalose synthase [Methanomassiliicoccales archaeon PtaU1.Bin124]|nr:MAG: Trehalose synthase [Methanomassiliicoccales archaeon PtaU1.Bin124]